MLLRKFSLKLPLAGNGFGIRCFFLLRRRHGKAQKSHQLAGKEVPMDERCAAVTDPHKQAHKSTHTHRDRGRDTDTDKTRRHLHRRRHKHWHKRRLRYRHRHNHTDTHERSVEHRVSSSGRLLSTQTTKPHYATFSNWNYTTPDNKNTRSFMLEPVFTPSKRAVSQANSCPGMAQFEPWIWSQFSVPLFVPSAVGE